MAAALSPRANDTDIDLLDSGSGDYVPAFARLSTRASYGEASPLTNARLKGSRYNRSAKAVALLHRHPTLDDTRESGRHRSPQARTGVLVSRAGFLPAEHDLSLQQRQLAPEIFHALGRFGVHVAIPHRDIGVLADLDRADPIVEEHLMGRPDRLRAKRGVDITRFGGTKRLRAVSRMQRRARRRRPQTVARRKRRDAEIGPAAPLDAFLHVRLERLQPLAALGSEVARVVVAEPPHERGLRFRISRVVGFLQPRHHVDGVIRGRVRVDDSVAQSARRLRLQDLIVGVDHPVDRLVAYR